MSWRASGCDLCKRLGEAAQERGRTILALGLLRHQPIGIREGLQYLCHYFLPGSGGRMLTKPVVAVVALSARDLIPSSRPPTLRPREIGAGLPLGRRERRTAH
jgi:hypothetical protein